MTVWWSSCKMQPLKNSYTIYWKMRIWREEKMGEKKVALKVSQKFDVHSIIKQLWKIFPKVKLHKSTCKTWQVSRKWWTTWAFNNCLILNICWWWSALMRTSRAANKVSQTPCWGDKHTPISTYVLKNMQHAFWKTHNVQQFNIVYIFSIKDYMSAKSQCQNLFPIIFCCQ